MRKNTIAKLIEELAAAIAAKTGLDQDTCRAAVGAHLKQNTEAIVANAFQKTAS